MEHFAPIPLSVSGKPILLDDEVEIKSEADAQVFLQQDKVIVKELFPVGNVVLTNFRFIALVQGASSHGFVGWGFHLSLVSNLEDCAGFLKRSSRLRIKFLEGSAEIGVKFMNGPATKEEFISHASRTLARKTWEAVAAAKAQADKKATEAAAFSVSNAGVSGLLRRQERDLQSADNISKEALTDLDALMRSAKEVVGIVQRYAAISAERYAERGEDHSETSTEIGETNEMDSILQSIGIISPVTKFSAGRMYHTELGRQLADVLLTGDRMRKLGGSVTLTDLYCLFNRARGTELVSPNDFLKAAEVVDKLGVGLKLKRYPSGVRVLHLESLNETVAAQQLLKLCDDPINRSTGISCTVVANALNVSLVVAKELLLSTEASGALCRDECLDGLYFYRNVYFV